MMLFHIFTYVEQHHWQGSLAYTGILPQRLSVMSYGRPRLSLLLEHVGIVVVDFPVVPVSLQAGPEYVRCEKKWKVTQKLCLFVLKQKTTGGPVGVASPSFNGEGREK